MEAEPYPIKTVTYKRKRANGDTYIYRKQTRYDPKKKWNVTLKTELIGKIPKGSDAMVNTRPKKKPRARPQNQALDGQPRSTGQESVKTAAVRRTGMTDLIEYVGSRFGIAQDVIEAYGQADGRKLLSVAWYLLATDGASLPGIESWCIRHPTPYHDGITEDIYCRLFNDIGRDEDALQRLFLARSELVKPGGSIAFDSSTCSCYGKNIIDARYGYNKRNDGLPTVKLLVLYSIDGRQPVAFAKQPGDIPDVISLANALEQFKALGLSKCTICMDEGFYSQHNIQELFEHHVRFLVRPNINSSLVRAALKANFDKLRRAENVCRSDPDILCVKAKSTFEYQTTLKRGDKRTGSKAGSVKSHEHAVYLGLYRSKQRAANCDAVLHAHLEDLRCRVERKEELSSQGQRDCERFLIVTKGHGSVKTKINSEAFDEEVNRAGLFAVMTNANGNLEDWLDTYRLRENIEDVFCDLRNHVSLTTPRQWTTDGFKGRIIAAFITLCYRLGFLAILKEAKDKLARDIDELRALNRSFKQEKALKSWIEGKSLHEILMWFDCIEETVVRTPAGQRRWETEKTQRDALFLDYIGYSDWHEANRHKRIVDPIILG